MTIGDSRPVNLFILGINQYSLAFGNMSMIYKGNNQFAIADNEFDFDYQPKASLSRNIATFFGGCVFGQFFQMPITLDSIYRVGYGYGGSFNVHFIGTVTIPK